jgi:hypothetical protein
VEQDHGHPYIEQELGAHPAERIGDEPEHRWPYKGARRSRYELRDQASTQYEAKVTEDLLYLLHTLVDQGYELLGQRAPTQMLHAIPAHDLLAPPPILLGQAQVVA